jgi:hypothetical protein
MKMPQSEQPIHTAPERVVVCELLGCNALSDSNQFDTKTLG